jgi:UDP-2,3-diacylglucosamine pyrophosphatase LpxH
VGLPDSHGHHIDWEAAEAALAFVRFYKPGIIYMLGDHVDFAALSRFVASPAERASLMVDVNAAQAFLAKVRKSAPKAEILYLKGNHEARMQKFLWTRAAELEGVAGLRVPQLLKLSDYGIAWEETGAHMATPKLLVKHGDIVRSRSGVSANAEMDRNGCAVVHGHTHRACVTFKRIRTGMMAGVESGCLCKYDPGYMGSQTADWAQAVSYGAIDLRGSGYSASVAPIVNGWVRFADKAISA